ncbi:carbohydrate-binding family 9-like protein [Sphingobacterium deserti]|nr:carbohydrate-binding family 9-like protein [Sphingobacterium deserti]
MRYVSLFAISYITLSMPSAHAQRQEQVSQMQSTPLVYAAKKINTPIEIDGRANESAWAEAAWTSAFTDIEGEFKPSPKLLTKAKMLWDDENLYIYAKLDEPHIWGDITEPDAIIYHNNDFEVFIKPFEQQSFYYEIEVNALNTIMDLMMPKAYRLGGDALMHWDVKGLKSAVHIEGTLNDARDEDHYWAVEMAIPFRSLHTFAGKATPKVDSYWRVNFSRVQWQHELINGRYQRKKSDDKFVPEDNWVWSPIGVVNMHHPERWGYLKFVEEAQPNATPPKTDEAERLAWNIFYLQQAYYRTHHKYATTIEALPKYKDILQGATGNHKCSFIFNTAKSFYKLTVVDNEKKFSITLDNHGNYHTHYE